ncbi:MAG: TetR/AcrR family transcriptional regulator [Hespellia sp.]|nr:TetR/AcrR family transcriptional regulator [Hespellia sp.]
MITKQMLRDAAISCVAEIGLENFTTKKTADLIGISEGTIFNNYPNKTALLVDCLYSIDTEIDEVLKAVPFHVAAFTSYVHDMWYAYFNYLVSHGDKAAFYFQFRHSSYYTPEVIEGQRNSFGFFSKFLISHMHLFRIQPDVFWVFVIETTMNFAIRFANGHLELNDENVQNLYHLIVNGIAGIYHPTSDFK